ncbi:NADH-ubiquinone oxidoreductase chain 5 [Frankliniella fusca]|uniref:NADH-ubiquinone oxidoreductase chain 5 n=1 Tax=Frankliniella fusca TaxID=407009 RepID=A0AAE1LAK8_9NEOP|nr:NADH-ubiquinone oxidoreductase chain 5 [Frankliniella fusca]
MTFHCTAATDAFVVLVVSILGIFINENLKSSYWIVSLMWVHHHSIISDLVISSQAVWVAFLMGMRYEVSILDTAKYLKTIKQIRQMESLFTKIDLS